MILQIHRINCENNTTELYKTVMPVGANLAIKPGITYHLPWTCLNHNRNMTSVCRCCSFRWLMQLRILFCWVFWAFSVKFFFSIWCNPKSMRFVKTFSYGRQLSNSCSLFRPGFFLYLIYNIIKRLSKWINVQKGNDLSVFAVTGNVFKVNNMYNLWKKIWYLCLE